MGTSMRVLCCVKATSHELFVELKLTGQWEILEKAVNTKAEFATTLSDFYSFKRPLLSWCRVLVQTNNNNIECFQT